MSSTRPECSSGTENVNRHADGEDPRAAVFNYVPYAIPKDEWAPVADFTREVPQSGWFLKVHDLRRPRDQAHRWHRRRCRPSTAASQPIVAVGLASHRPERACLEAVHSGRSERWLLRWSWLTFEHFRNEATDFLGPRTGYRACELGPIRAGVVPTPRRQSRRVPHGPRGPLRGPPSRPRLRLRFHRRLPGCLARA